MMLLKSEHKEGGGSRDTMEQSELSQAMETKKEESCFQFSDIFLFRLSLALKSLLETVHMYGFKTKLENSF